MIKAILKPATDIMFSKSTLRVYDENNKLIVAIRCDEIHRPPQTSDRICIEAIFNKQPRAMIFCDKYEDKTQHIGDT